MKKAAILVGHRSKAQGAYSKFLAATEFEFNSLIVEKLTDVADIYYRPDTPGVAEVTRIKEVVSEINQKDYDIVIELHFNSAGNESANGCEVLYYHTNQKAKELAEFFVDEMQKRIALKKRRLIAIESTNERGGTFIIKSKPTALLLEPFFGSNYEDCEKISAYLDEYRQIIRDLIDKA